jgi:hypothetical protein
MYFGTITEELARTRHRELLDQAARHRLVREAHRARRPTRPRPWGKIAKLISRSAPGWTGPPARACDPSTLPIGGKQ